MRWVGIFWAAALLAQPPVRTPVYGYTVVHAFPHDGAAYTQGLEFHDGFLYESTGLNGRSSLRKVRLETGQVIQKIDLASEYFGEGITLVGGRIVQLTWRSQIGFVYDLADFHLLRQFSYTGEGWGLTHNGREIFMSDGTADLRVWDAATLAEKRRLQVRDGTAPVTLLNELEYVDGEILANVYTTDRIARISPRTGQVTAWIDLAGLLSPMYRAGTVDVLNGIAYDAARKRLFVTGKLWPALFEIRLVPKGGK